MGKVGRLYHMKECCYEKEDNRKMRWFIFLIYVVID